MRRAKRLQVEKNQKNEIQEKDVEMKESVNEPTVNEAQVPAAILDHVLMTRELYASVVPVLQDQGDLAIVDTFKIQSEYGYAATHPRQPVISSSSASTASTSVIAPIVKTTTDDSNSSTAVTLAAKTAQASASSHTSALTPYLSEQGQQLLAQRRLAPALPPPKWHAPWRLMRVISGHLGWVRSLAVDASNSWFATGSADRTIKIWDLASGALKVTLTGHINSVRGLAISDRHPYLYSAGDDKIVACWDLETNRRIRQYFGHISGVYCMALHPTLDLLVTAGRDCVVRVWDVRTREPVQSLLGHSNTIASVVCQAAEPQIISAGMDAQIRTWDLVAGKARSVLTHHKKSVRSLVLHHDEFTMASAAPDHIKKWLFPEPKFMHNFTGHKAVLNTLALNQDNVLFSGADDGTMSFWDWQSGYQFQSTQTIVQPGSLDAEAGIFCSQFDRSGTRLITGEADKTIKIWCEDETATPETHPIRQLSGMVPTRF